MLGIYLIARYNLIYKDEDENCFDRVRKLYEVEGIIYAVIFGLLSIYCLCSYCYLYFVIKQYFDDDLKEERELLAN